MNAMQAQGSNQLHAQIIVNPKRPNVSEISLIFGKNVEAVEPPSGKNKRVVKPMHDSKVVVEKAYVPLIPFPQRVVKTKKMNEEDMDKEILNVFRKMVVNIPLLDVIK